MVLCSWSCVLVFKENRKGVTGGNELYSNKGMPKWRHCEWQIGRREQHRLNHWGQQLESNLSSKSRVVSEWEARRIAGGQRMKQLLIKRKWSGQCSSLPFHPPERAKREKKQYAFEGFLLVIATSLLRTLFSPVFVFPLPLWRYLVAPTTLCRIHMTLSKNR